MLIIPATIIGIILGLIIAQLLLPFMVLPTHVDLYIPLISLGIIVAMLIATFIILQTILSSRLHRVDINEIIRPGEE